jgi:hypothetical protein
MDIQSVTCNIPHTPFISNSPILDLSQRDIINPTSSIVIIDNWINNSQCNYTDRIDDDNISRIEIEKKFNIEQSLTDQFEDVPLREDSMSDSSTINQSKLDLCYLTKKTK